MYAANHGFQPGGNPWFAAYIQPTSIEFCGVVIFDGHDVIVLWQTTVELHEVSAPPTVACRLRSAALAATSAAVCASSFTQCMYPRSTTRPMMPNMGTKARVTMINVWPPSRRDRIECLRKSFLPKIASLIVGANPGRNAISPFVSML